MWKYRARVADLKQCGVKAKEEEEQDVKCIFYLQLYIFASIKFFKVNILLHSFNNVIIVKMINGQQFCQTHSSIKQSVFLYNYKLIYKIFNNIIYKYIIQLFISSTDILLYDLCTVYLRYKNPPITNINCLWNVQFVTLISQHLQLIYRILIMLKQI